MKKIYLLLILVISLVSCENNISENIENTPIIEEKVNIEEVIEEEIIEEEIVDVVIEEEVIEEVVVIDMNELYRENSVNELGQVMVIMYHNLAEKPGAYATTKELFIADLERLYSEGYRTVSMTDLVTNNIDIPMGTTPVVLTFDDASKSNFYYEEDGSMSSDSVVSILDEFSKSHKDFGRNAIFYLYGENPFRQRDKLKEKLEYLIINGYEIGTHTYDHDNLSKLGAEGIQKSIGKNEGIIDGYLTDHDMKHLSLPYGKKPSDNLKKYLFEGSYGDISYNIISAVNVGWNPIKSPSHKDFNAKSINRVTVGDDDFELNYWLDYFLENPSRKYVSDGNADTIVIPEDGIDNINEKYIDNAIIYSLESDKEE